MERKEFIKSIAKQIDWEYVYLGDFYEQVPEYEGALQEGYRWMEENPDMVEDLKKCRKDILTTDHEVAALGLALEEFGLDRERNS